MAKFKDENGDEFEAFTQQELDAKAKELSDAAAVRAVEDYKAANPAKSAEQVAAEKAATDAKTLADNEPITKLTKTVEALQQQLTQERVSGFAKTYAGNDQAKQTEFKAKFDRLTGYSDTPEGVAERAADAAKLIGVNPQSVDIGGIVGAGSGRNVDGAGAMKITEADKVVQNALGISAEDVKKYGGDTVNK
jgi:membrane protein involved in colicin uptake